MPLANTPKIKLDTNTISAASSSASPDSEPILVPVFNSKRQSISNSISSSSSSYSHFSNSKHNNDNTQIIISNVSKSDFTNVNGNDNGNDNHSFVDDLHKLVTDELINLNQLESLIKWTNLPSLNRIILNFTNSEITLKIKNLISLNYLNLNEKPKNLTNLKISLVSPLTSFISNNDDSTNLKSPTYKESELQRIENLKRLYSLESINNTNSNANSNRTIRKLSLDTANNNLLDYSEPEPEPESPLYKDSESPILTMDSPTYQSISLNNSNSSLNSINSANSINSVVLLNGNDTNSKVSIIKSEQPIDTTTTTTNNSPITTAYKSPVISKNHNFH
ncbi:hypothetical protein B5S33_g2461 [[Candida] boidinii]|nr:hypothetical protein B5S33_g2461 [[Candida] boidinii]